MTKLPPFIDLLSLASERDKGRSGKSLKKVVESAWRAQSCLADLSLARQCCDALDAVYPPSDIPHGSIIRHSLLTTGIVLYVRATSTSSGKGERGPIQLNGADLNEQQLAAHRSLIRIRKEALAHVQFDASIDGEYWHKDYVAAIRHPDGSMQTIGSTAQLGFNDKAFAQLKEMLPIARKTVMAALAHRRKALREHFSTFAIDPVTMARHRIDPVEIFGSIEDAEHFLRLATGN